MDAWVAGLTAFFVALVTTPVVINLAKKFGFVDQPNRSHPAILHKKPIPRGGGVPPLLGFVGAIALIVAISPTFVLTKSLVGIILAGVFLVVVGVLDDKYDLNPYLRLVTNFVAVGIVVASGIGINSFTNPFGGQIVLNSIVFTIHLPGYFLFLAGTHHLVLLADLVAFVWIVWLMNGLNWSSGVDGQLSGIAAVALLILGIASVELVQRDPTQVATAVVAFAAGGAFLGFLPWSFYPQKIMPGYGGSTLAGFLIAVLAIISGAKLATAFLVLLVPLVDSLWTVARRLASHHSPVWGDRLHLHHQLLQMGWSIPQICLFYYLICLVLGILALSFDTEKKFFALAILIVLTFSLLFTTYVLLRRLNFPAPKIK